MKITKVYQVVIVDYDSHIVVSTHVNYDMALNAWKQAVKDVIADNMDNANWWRSEHERRDTAYADELEEECKKLHSMTLEESNHFQGTRPVIEEYEVT